jgi:hypothetical protein
MHTQWTPFLLFAALVACGTSSVPGPTPAVHAVHTVAKAGPEYLTPWGWSTVPFVPPAASDPGPRPSFAHFAIPAKQAKAVTLTPLASSLASEVPAVTPVSWLQPEWDFSPVGGDDANNCLSVSTPCKTFAQIAARWGTLEPTFPQNTFVRQLTAQPDTSDPVRIRVHTSGTATFWYVGVPSVLTTGTLGTVTPKSYGSAGSGHPLEAVLPAGQSAGFLITDTTRGSSTGFLDRVTTGTTWIVEQPLTAPVLPNTTFGGGRTENNAWATGDAYTIAQLPSVYMLEWQPTFGDFNSSFTSYPQLQDVQVMDPAASPGFSPMIVKNFSVWQDVSILRSVGMVTQNAQSFICQGCDFAGEVSGVTAWGATSGLVGLYGGAIRSLAVSVVDGADIGLDIIIGNGSGGTLNQNGGRWGFTGTAGIDGVYIDTDGVWQPTGYGVVRCAGSCAAQVYGPGTLDVGGSVSMAVASATSTILMAAWQMNGTTTACAQSNVTPSVTNCGIALTPANYDAPFGVAGFGGIAKSPFTGATIQAIVNN